jgi:aryl-alcohol dehydrogenase-like predicted oxidoreductase
MNDQNLISGAATAAGTGRYAARFPEAAAGHFREAHGLKISSLGIGTYLGNYDEATDESYAQSIERFVELGGHVIDTAANYRFQRSERNIGEALKRLAEKDFGRDEVLICTKGGYLPFDSVPPTNVRQYFEDTFVKTGIATFDDLVAGSHCMTPKYLQSQIDQSRANMGIETLDVFYIHNPESQLSEVDKYTFDAKLAKAFEALEESRAAGKIKFYGVATWNGFRVQPTERGYHSLERMVAIARQIGGEEHGFKFIQLPYNLAMPEAYLMPNQASGGVAMPTIAAANVMDVTVMVSASILQGKLAGGLPENIIAAMGNPATEALASIQFARSTPGVSTALIGMSKVPHVEENLTLAEIAPVGEEEFNGLFQQD